MTEPKIFWEPNKENFKNIKMVGFAEQVKQHFGFDWQITARICGNGQSTIDIIFGL